jgi:peptidylprolyl isomerase
MLFGILPVLLALAIIGCAPATVSDKKVVQMSYKGTLSDGTVFDESTAAEPLEFMVGAGKMIPSLEQQMLGMKVGDKKTIAVKSADAYGEYDKTAIQDVPKDQFPADLQLESGKLYSVQTPQGVLTVTITAIKDKTVTVDFNHPLAGKDLTFDIQIVKLRAATKEELATLLQEQQAQQAPATPQ